MVGLGPSPDNALFVATRFSRLLAPHPGGLDQRDVFLEGPVMLVYRLPGGFQIGLEKGSTCRTDRFIGAHPASFSLDLGKKVLGCALRPVFLVEQCG